MGHVKNLNITRNNYREAGMSKKVFSVNGEDYWDNDWSSLIDRLMSEYETDNKADLIGKTYYEGDEILVPVKKMVNIDFLIQAMNETVWDIAGESADDWPGLNDEQKQELEQIITDYLIKAKVREFFEVENVKEKTITAEIYR
jgi:hypothetical protein